MSRYFNRASSLTGLRRVGAQTNQDVKAALLAVGLSGDLFKHPTKKIAFEDACELFEHCALNWQIPDLGLRLATYQHLEILGPVALVTKVERDTRSAMQAIIHNLIIHSNALSVNLEEYGDVAGISIELHPKGAKTQQYLLLALGVALNILRQVAGQNLYPIEVTFRHPMDALRPVAERFFGCPVQFSAERNILFFDRAILSQPLRDNDAAYHALIAHYLITSRHEVAGTFVEDVSQEIARQMELGCCTLEGVARVFHLGPRSLQRRLSQDGTTFFNLVDLWRKARSILLLKQTRLPLSHISEALGYADQTVFSRAFRRWYGESPFVFRRRIASSRGQLDA